MQKWMSKMQQQQHQQQQDDNNTHWAKIVNGSDSYVASAAAAAASADLWGRIVEVEETKEPEQEDSRQSSKARCFEDMNGNDDIATAFVAATAVPDMIIKSTVEKDEEEGEGFVSFGIEKDDEMEWFSPLSPPPSENTIVNTRLEATAAAAAALVEEAVAAAETESNPHFSPDSSMPEPDVDWCQAFERKAHHTGGTVANANRQAYLGVAFTCGQITEIAMLIFDESSLSSENDNPVADIVFPILRGVMDVDDAIGYFARFIEIYNVKSLYVRKVCNYLYSMLREHLDKDVIPKRIISRCFLTRPGIISKKCRHSSDYDIRHCSRCFVNTMRLDEIYEEKKKKRWQQRRDGNSRYE
jgi:hypothetical protein